MSSEVNHLRQFGKFRLDAQKKVLWHRDHHVELPLKDIELLCILTEKRGDVVTKDELLERVWSGSFVEESNLSRHIYLLRKTFKDFGEAEDFILTVPRRGYRFAGEVTEVANGDLIIEKHTLTQTLIEEVNAPDAVARSVFAGSAETGRSLRQRLYPQVLIPAALILAIAVSGSFLLLNKRTDARGTESITSIAVLPLRSLNEKTEDTALSLGFADALITSLGGLEGIRVSSLGTAEYYADLRRESAAVGKDLGVDCVLDGTLQKANGKLRITLRLIRTSDGKQIWSSSFDEHETDIFHLQDAMATQTAKALALNLKLRDVKRPTENREAYQAYLRGRFFFDKRTPAYYEKAIADFERAISLDENYALAYTGLADVYAMKANSENGKERDALYEKARATANRVLEFDESSAEAHTSLGWIKRIHDWDWSGSEREFRRALDLNPKSVNAHQWYALLLTTLGRTDEALAEIEKARDLEPLSTIVLQNYFAVLQYRREKEMLPAIADQFANLSESMSEKTRLLSAAYSRVRDYAKVIELDEAYQQTHGGQNFPVYMAMQLAIAYGRTGQDSKAEEMIDYVRQRARTNSEAEYRLSTVLAELGRTEESIQLLQTCLAAHDDRLVWIRVEPSFDSLRSDSRFQALLRDLKLN